MSLDRQIRNLYTINFLIFIYIIWSILSDFCFENKIDYKLYIITLLAVFVLQYLNYKNFSKIVSAFISLIIAALLMYASMNNFKYLIINMIYYLFIIFLFSKYEKNSLDYYSLKDYVKKCIITMIVIAVIIFNIDIYQKQEILKFYIVYLASAIILLRKSRAYINNLYKKSSARNDIFITIILVVFCFDFVSNKVLKLINLIFSIIGLILSYVAIPIEYLFIKFVNLIYYLIGPNLRKMLQKIFKALGKAIYEGSKKPANNIKIDYSKEKISQTVNHTWISSVVGILVIAAIVYVVYKFVQGYAENKKVKISEGVFEEREKIKNYKRKKETKKIFRLLRRGKSINDRMIYLFAKFQYIALQKGLFKNSMTADELIKITREYLKADDEIKILAEAYNEAKFSGKEIHKDKYYDANRIYIKIKKLFRSNHFV